MSNIIELNEKLFKTLEGLESGEVSEKKAMAIVNVSNAICNNAKLAIQVAKLTKNGNIGNLLVGSENIPLNEPESKKKDLYDRKLEFAKKEGFKNISEAIGSLGKNKFDQQFKDEQHGNN